VAITNNLKKLVHRKVQEFCTPNPAGNANAGMFVVADESNMIPGHEQTYFFAGTSAIWNYNADEDSWIQAPNSGIAGAFGVGACGDFRPLSAPGGVFTQTATAGTTTTITSNLTLTRNLKGRRIRVIGGAGVGLDTTIVSNTIGANSVITVAAAASTAMGSTTQYQIFAGSVWFFNSGTSAVGFAVFDIATNVWTQRSVTGLPTSFGTSGQLVATPGYSSNNGSSFVVSTSTGSNTTTTLLDSTKTWPTNGFTNSQVRITGGTGAGQIRTVSSNTATALTVSAAWTVTPDATSTYAIEGNDEYLYLLGNNAVTLYRFTVSTNTWATMAPGSARGGNMGAGGTADWIDSVADSQWSDGVYRTNYSTQLKQLGRYFYCFRGGASNALDIYDIAANTWISSVPYGGQMEVFSTGTCSTDMDGVIYLMRDSTGRIHIFDIGAHELKAFTLNYIPSGTPTDGDKVFIQTVQSGSDRLTYLYAFLSSRPELSRWIIIK